MGRRGTDAKRFIDVDLVQRRTTEKAAVLRALNRSDSTGWEECSGETCRSAWTALGPSRANIEKPLPDLGGGKKATRTGSNELVSVASDDVVERIANRAGNQPCHPCHCPPPSQVSRDPQRRFRADGDCLHPTVRLGLDPNDRVDPSQLNMARADRRPVVSLERGKAQGLPAVMAQDETNAPRAEAAGAVVQEDGRWGRSLGQGSFPEGQRPTNLVLYVVASAVA